MVGLVGGIVVECFQILIALFQVYLSPFTIPGTLGNGWTSSMCPAPTILNASLSTSVHIFIPFCTLSYLIVHFYTHQTLARFGLGLLVSTHTKTQISIVVRSDLIGYYRGEPSEPQTWHTNPLPATIMHRVPAGPF